MGEGFGVKCNKCGYKFDAVLGFGMLFPVVYEENVKKMKAGELGPVGKKFFEDYPMGAIDSEQVVAKCSSCGNYEIVDDLSMYIPHKGKEHLVEKYGCVTSHELKINYKKYMDYPHKCTKCGADSIVYKNFETDVSNGVAKCPKCDGYMGMDPERIILWD